MAKKRKKDWDGYDMKTATLPKSFHKLASGSKLSGSAYNVYIYLFHNCDLASGRVNVVTFKQIAKHCHLSERQVYRAVGELRDKGFYVPSHRETRIGGRISPLLPPRG